MTCRLPKSAYHFTTLLCIFIKFSAAYSAGSHAGQKPDAAWPSSYLLFFKKSGIVISFTFTFGR